MVENLIIIVKCNSKSSVMEFTPYTNFPGLDDTNMENKPILY